MQISVRSDCEFLLHALVKHARIGAIDAPGSLVLEATFARASFAACLTQMVGATSEFLKHKP